MIKVIERKATLDDVADFLLEYKESISKGNPIWEAFISRWPELRTFKGTYIDYVLVLIKEARE